MTNTIDKPDSRLVDFRRIDPKFEGEGRFYELEGERYISVTTGLDRGLSKNDQMNANLLPGIKAAPDNAMAIMDRAALNKEEGRSKGTMVHALIEEEITGNEADVDEEWRKKLQGSVDSFHRFCDDYQPEFYLSEFTCFNRTYKYAGTGDIVCRTEKWGTSLGDWKTTRPGRHGHGIYPETVLQLNAYAYSDFIVVDGKRSLLPPIDTLLGINIRPQSYRVVPCEYSQRVFDLFTSVLTVANFKGGDGFHFLGRPVQG